MLAEQTLMIANRCNLKCTYCWYETGSADYADALVTPGEYDAWLGECGRLAPVESVNFTGGEPLLREDFLDIFEVAKRHARSLAVFTNGLRLTAPIVETLAGADCEIHVSLDHVSEHIGDRVRGGTAATLRALDVLAEAGVGARAQVCVVVTSHNWRDLEAVVERVVAAGFRLELIPVAVPDVHPLSLLTLSDQERSELGELLVRRRALLGRPLYYRRLENWLATGVLKSVPTCAAADRGIFVDASGSVQVCAQRRKVSLGNIKTDAPASVMARKAEEVARKRPGSCVSLDCLVVV
ncbi:radical SAM protein [Streptomyces sp. ME03-5709C]|nr:radical SAM protein [Streptomyces sp. ME03-5709C]